MNTQPATGLRVLGFCDYFTEESSGGAEKVTAEVYRRLIDLGAEVLVVTAVPGARHGRRDVYGIPTVVVPGHDLSRIVKAQVMVSKGAAKAARATLAELKPNVVHASSIHFQGSAVAARLARRSGLPLVTTGHVGSITALPVLTRLATQTYEHSVSRMILRASKRVIAVSQAVATHMVHLGAKADLVRVVPNGVDHSRFRPQRDDHENVNVVFVGRLIQNKGPDEVLAAFAEVSRGSARLTFLGDGPMRGDLEEMANRLNVADRVQFLGHVDDVAPHLATADVLVRPSRTEGQSLAILEAMASGVAVLASDIDANAELVESGGTGLLVPPGNSHELARALASLIEDQDMRIRLAAAGRQRALEHSWGRCAEETGRVLAEAAELEEIG